MKDCHNPFLSGDEMEAVVPVVVHVATCMMLSGDQSPHSYLVYCGVLKTIAHIPNVFVSLNCTYSCGTPEKIVRVLSDR